MQRVSTKMIHPPECGIFPGQFAFASAGLPCCCAFSTEGSDAQPPLAAGKFRRGRISSAPKSRRPPPFLLPLPQFAGVLPFDLNVNLDPFFRCHHCPCTVLSPVLGTGHKGRAFRPLSVCVTARRFYEQPPEEQTFYRAESDTLTA